MEVYEFEEKMKTMLHKMSEVSGLNFEWHLVSADSDCVADFGCDQDGNLSIDGESFPLKINDMTGIRYRWNGETDDSDCFIRYDFGENIYLDCCFGDCDWGHMYHVKYNDTHKACLSKEEAIELLKQCASSNKY